MSIQTSPSVQLFLNLIGTRLTYQLADNTLVVLFVLIDGLSLVSNIETGCSPHRLNKTSWYPSSTLREATRGQGGDANQGE
ncbi:hypothetical protein SAMN02745181_0722 [Rubritalea squalenifaciens DSM 18772]|uniref:Uncharacterized protein n=1 Tax=Rubritalea squalenifaciens DSM 18772 TaxID=1123071 RepID=A0A1M6DEZ6_9BACT|nr:hypothetical protein SAMN02745181_0722 [Rubritalea squalenifaciens DSM 18772]